MSDQKDNAALPVGHNCDAMGCSSVEHVLAKVPFEDQRKSAQPEGAVAWISAVELAAMQRRKNQRLVSASNERDHHFDTPLYTRPAEVTEEQRDAARWRALMGSARIRFIGAAGLAGDCSDAVLCVEFHGYGDPTQDGPHGRDGLTQYADKRAALAALVKP